jgi:hypothetical protein
MSSTVLAAYILLLRVQKSSVDLDAIQRLPVNQCPRTCPRRRFYARSVFRRPRNEQHPKMGGVRIQPSVS